MNPSSRQRSYANPILISFLCVSFGTADSFAQKRRIPTGGRLAVVVDERLAALRAAPNLSARLVERLSRGRFVAITGAERNRQGITFLVVKTSRRRRGWLQSDAVVSPSRTADDQRLLRLIQASADFDRIVRARIFLDNFPRSKLRPVVLMLYGDVAEEAAAKLSREAVRRLDELEMVAGGAPQFTYFLNYNGLDRYNRQGVKFVFDHDAKRFHYDGRAWREIVRRFPKDPLAREARQRLTALQRRT